VRCLPPHRSPDPWPSSSPLSPAALHPGKNLSPRGVPRIPRPGGGRGVAVSLIGAISDGVRRRQGAASSHLTGDAASQKKSQAAFPGPISDIGAIVTSRILRGRLKGIVVQWGERSPPSPAGIQAVLEVDVMVEGYLAGSERWDPPAGLASSACLGRRIRFREHSASYYVTPGWTFHGGRTADTRNVFLLRTYPNLLCLAGP